jgi:hypothetical protein
MSEPDLNLSARFSRVVRWQRLRAGLLVVGIFIALVGGYAEFLTIHYNSDQQTAILAEQPKAPQMFFLWFPAPQELRLTGAILVLVGLGLAVLNRPSKALRDRQGEPSSSRPPNNRSSGRET